METTYVEGEILYRFKLLNQGETSSPSYSGSELIGCLDVLGIVLILTDSILIVLTLF